MGQLVGEVTRRFPNLTANPAALVVAVNQEYRDHSYPLREGDEVALIPPVSGGVR